MIPILFENTATVFTTNGVGRLADATYCHANEERNGVYELDMDMPTSSPMFEHIAVGSLIVAKTRPGGTNQIFEVSQISSPINGVAQIHAPHISYRLNKVVAMPFTATSCVQALAGLGTNAADGCAFTFWTDKSTVGSFKVKVPTPIRALLGGQEGSILDVYGSGEYEFDNFDVKLHVQRGQNRGVTIRYGKNLADLVSDKDASNIYTGIVPYYSNNEVTVTLPEKVIWGEHKGEYPVPMAKVVDFSTSFENPPTELQLRTAAEQYIAASNGWQIDENLNTSFVNLADTQEYKNVSARERVDLCDTVTIVTALGEEVTAKVIRVDFDVLAERYTKIEVGTSRTNLSQAIAESIGVEELPDKSFMEAAIERASQLIRGGLGGYVVMKPNANGEPEEILIMDTPDINTATNVIRMNNAGIAFSTHGYNPEFFDTAWTIDGAFNADYITSGAIQAGLITTGIIRDKAGQNWWNLDDGTMHISAESYIDTSDFVTQAQFTAAADRIATEVVEQVGSGIFFNVVPTDNDNGTTTLQAHLYLNRNDATESYAPGFYQWYKKTEDGKEFLGHGYEITVVNNEYGYGGEVEAVFVMLEDRIPVNSQGKWVFTMSGNYFTLATSQGSLLLSQGHPMVLSDAQQTADVYPVFAYDYQ